MKHAYRAARSGMGLAILPLAFLASAIWLRHLAGPDWIWRYMDPDYFYLFDGLNVAELTPPHHIYHPGLTVHLLIGLTLKLMHPLLGGAALAEQVIADPLFHLSVAATVLLTIDALATYFAGWASWKTTRSIAAVILVQLGPVLSAITLFYGIHARPETLLIGAVMTMAGLTMMALRDGALDQHRGRYAILFGLVVAFGAATKITALPLLVVMPVFLLARWRAVLLFWIAAGLAFLLVLSPIFADLGHLASWLSGIATNSGSFGGNAGAAAPIGSYLHQIRRMLARPVLNVPLILGLAILIWGMLRRRKGLPVRMNEMRALGGVLLGVMLQAMVVAKQPSGHYMIPAFCIGGLALALCLRIVADPRWWSEIAHRRLACSSVVVAIALIVAQGIGIAKLAKELRRFQAEAAPPAVETDGKVCAQVFFYTASHPDFALLMGHYQSGYRFADEVRRHVAPTSYYVRDWLPWDPSEVRNLDGPVPIRDILASHPCTIFRGGHADRFHTLLRREDLDDLKFDAVCPGAAENAYVIGARCATSEPAP